MALFGRACRNNKCNLVKTCILGVMPGRKEGAPRMQYIDNIKKWTGASLEETVRLTEDRTAWRERSCAAGAANVRTFLSRTSSRHINCSKSYLTTHAPTQQHSSVSGGSWGLGALGPAIRWGPLQRFSSGGLGRRKSPSGVWGRAPEAKDFGNNILKIG